MSVRSSGPFQSNRPQNGNLHRLPLALLLASIPIHSCTLLSLFRPTICSQLVYLPHLFYVTGCAQLVSLFSNLDTGTLDHTAQMATHAFVCDVGINDPVFAFICKSQGQLHGDQVRGGVAQAEFLVGFANVVVGREAKNQLRMRGASLLTVCEEGVQSQKGCAEEMSRGKDLAGPVSSSCSM
jgi:hypothetical protein